MKKLLQVFFTLMLPVIFLPGFQSCNDRPEGNPDKGIGKTGNDIGVTELPKGKQVVEDDGAFVTRPGNNQPVVPVSGPKKDGAGADRQITSTAPESRSDQLKKIYKTLLVFHADDTMEVNKSKLATLILAKNESIAKLKVQVLEESNASDESIKSDTTMDFGSKMRAKLLAFGGSKLDNSFEIEALGSDEQSFRSDRKKIMWQWKITPLKEGQHELKLSIQIIEKDGEAVYLPARNIPVVIFAKKKSFMTKVGDFFSTKYEWILTAIFLPVFIAWLTSRIRSRNNRPPQT